MRITALDKAIRAIDADIQVLQAARARLVEQQKKAPAKRTKPVAVAAKEDRTA